MPIARTELQPDGYYWARRIESDEMEVVQVSTVFGRHPDYLTVAILSSDQHYTLEEFEFYAVISPPGAAND
ncbi:acetyl-CoA carboxylase alpha subunit [Rhizobium sp. BK313]|uniref:hypothetical protein n=1 Tax=Rhizobium sp. BK313 TaxID=2587081 RepID=UPI00106008DF|nr:hypothetical protein [Rhizobium sp. BK313]MBB3452751.1 acetyl-CoA carboxylase alpha subunit [Rhizobium sp. BK313]